MADPQDGTIADGPDGQHLVYRSGSWYPAQPDGRPIERIPRSDYGAGHYQLPNGDIVRQGPRGGQETVENFGAAGGSGPGGGMTVGADARGRYNIGIDTMIAAERKTAEQEARGGNPLNRDWGALALDKFGVDLPGDNDIKPLAWLAPLVGGQDYQDYNQALASYEASLMPIMSGAAVSASEARRMIRADFPALNDSKETLRTKAQNRQRRINAVAQGLGRESIFSDQEIAAGRSDGAAGPMGENGLPTYPGLVAASAGLTDAPAGQSGGPVGPDGGGGPVDPNAPKPGDVRVSSQPLAEDDTPASLAAQGYVYDAARDTWSRTRQEQAPDPMQGYGTALQQERANADRLAPLGGGVSMSSQTTAPFNDELAYAAGYLTQGAGNIGRRLAGRDVEVSAAARGRAAQTVYQQDQANYAKEHPGRNAFAQVAGSAAIGSGGPSTMLTRIVGGGGVGTAFGASSGDSWGERGRNALIGAGVGAAASPVAERIIAPIAGRAIGAGVNAFQDVSRFAGRQAGRAGEALGVPGAAALVERAQPNVLAQSVNRFASRAPQDVNALRSNVDRFRAQGIEPTFADAVNDGGRGVMRATATRQTPARQAAREFADNRATGLQDRVSSQARRHISDDPRSPMEMTAEMTAKRSREADAAFGGVRGDLISPDRAVLEALRTPAMRPAIEEAMTSALNRGDQETAGLLRNLTDDALEYGADAQITVGMADRISRSLNGRAEALQRAGNNDAAAAQFALAERLRGSARSQSPGYDTALRQFADESGKIDAVALGEGFMTMEADQFAAAVAQLAPEERAVAQAAARRAVERQAGTQGNAPGVAQRLSGGREQGMRSAALLDDPEALQTAMATEREALRNAQAVNPSAGSQTSMNAQDAMNAAGVLGGARDVMTGNVGGILGRIANGIKSRGFNDQQAEAIVSAAIDPTRTDELINMLAKSMNRREARNLARTIRYQLTTAGGQSRSTS